MYTQCKINRLKAIRPPVFICLFLSVLLLTLFSSKAMAQGNLMITPRRVVFEGQKRTQELNLANTGKDTARYLISMIEIKMTSEGGFEQITVPDSGQNFATKYVRFFPRSVTLGPGEAQTVKIQVTKQSQLLVGEYRSHIYFRAIPGEVPLGQRETLKDTAAISVQLTSIFGISIPVIIRVGEPTTETSFSNTKIEMWNNAPVLSMMFNRTGNMSVYGDLQVDYISPNGKVTRVGEINGIAVYTPTLSRKVKVALDKAAGINYRTGKLHIVYTTSSDARSAKIAESELELKL